MEQWEGGEKFFVGKSPFEKRAKYWQVMYCCPTNTYMVMSNIACLEFYPLSFFMMYLFSICVFIFAISFFAMTKKWVSSYNKSGKIFSEASIHKVLINKRVKLAKKNHDKYIVSMYIKKNGKSRKKEQSDNDRLLYSMMPKRKNWVNLGKTRCINKDGKKIPKDSVQKNIEKIKRTIKRDSKKGNLSYLRKLNNFTRQVQLEFLINDFEIKKPLVVPLKKKDGEARPLCIFDLKSNLILQEVNTFLVNTYDHLFENTSYAFRGKNESNRIPTHHDTIAKILEYKNKHANVDVYVTECDLKKFFDTINHEIVLEKFDKLLNSNQVHTNFFLKKRIKNILKKYLHVYNFRESVFNFNDDKTYFSKNRCDGCRFKWISDDELIKIYGDGYKEEKIGVPQGGALSGFIANLVLDEVDKKLKNLDDSELLYIRYCDDMIMLHTNKEKLINALNIYQSTIKKNKLFIHDPKEIESYGKSFYDVKSKLPYKWGTVKDNAKNAVPWISFVGYQIGYKGEVRVRKSSIEKEIVKQNRIVGNTIKIVKNEKKTGGSFNINYIIRSVKQRLQGMSVGRVMLFTHNDSPSLCWVNGFKMVDPNTFSLGQMRLLDKNRNREINILCQELKKISDDKDLKSMKNENKDSIIPHEIVYSGKPFSYFGWLEEKGKNENRKRNVC